MARGGGGGNWLAEVRDAVGGGTAPGGGIWSPESLRATAALAAAALFEVLGGVQMKRARGFADQRATLLAVCCAFVCVACTVELLDCVELSIGWAIYTVFELGGVVAAGVVLEGEALNRISAAGLLAVLAGSVLLDSQPAGRGAREGECKATVNVLLLVVALVICFVGMLVCQRARLRAHAPQGGEAESESSASSSALPRFASPAGGRRRRLILLYGGLVLATVCEVAGALFMKLAHGYRSLPYVFLAFVATFVNVCVTIVMLAHGTLSFAWALYTALEYLSILAVGVLGFREALTPIRAAGLLLTTLGAAALVVEEEGLLEDESS